MHRRVPFEGNPTLGETKMRIEKFKGVGSYLTALSAGQVQDRRKASESKTGIYLHVFVCVHAKCSRA